MNHKEKRKYWSLYFSRMCHRINSAYDKDSMFNPGVINYDIYYHYLVIQFQDRRYMVQLIGVDQFSSRWLIVSQSISSPKEQVISVDLDETTIAGEYVWDTFMKKLRELYKYECQFYGIPDKFAAQFVAPYPVVINPKDFNKEKVHESIEHLIDKSSET